MDNSAVFRDDDAARRLGTVVASLSRLSHIHLDGCQLSDDGLRHIVDGVVRGCLRLTVLWCWDNRDRQLTSASEETLRRLLTRLPGVKIQVWLSQSPPSWISRLRAEFPDGRVV